MAQSTLPPPPLRPVSRCGLSGAGVTTSRFSSRGRYTVHKIFSHKPGKNFASAGQLPRDVVTDAPSERSTAGRNPEEVDGRRGFRPSGSNRSARRPDSAEGDVFMTVSSTISVFAATGCSVPFTATCTVSRLERSHPAYPLCHRSAGRSHS